MIKQLLNSVFAKYRDFQCLADQLFASDLLARRKARLADNPSKNKKKNRNKQTNKQTNKKQSKQNKKAQQQQQ